MSLKWLGLSNWCKHGNYEDNCEMCAKDNKTEKLEEVFRIAKLFVNCEYPEGCTKDNWFSEIDKFADQRSLLENELIEAINKIESPEDVIPIKNDYKYEIQALLDEEADQETRLQKERAKLDNVMTQLGKELDKLGDDQTQTPKYVPCYLEKSVPEGIIGTIASLCEDDAVVGNRVKLDSYDDYLGRWTVCIVYKYGLMSKGDNMKPGQGCDPHSKPPTVSGRELFDFLHLCRCHLYLRNFTSDAENVKIKARIDDWLYTYKDELANNDK